MATLAQKEALAQLPAFQAQIKQQILQQAKTILTSAVTAYKSLDAYAKSVALANSIISSPSSYVDRFAESASAFGTFVGIATPVATDAEVAAIIPIIFPYLAGISFSDQ